jgi:outer membrane receptor protein involved in Fe transport
MGNIDARNTPAGGPNRPTVAQLTAWFPEAFNVDTWNLNALNPWIRRYVIGISDDFPVRHSHPKYGFWVQDDWSVTDRLTLNLGLRYDYIHNANNNEKEQLPWMEGGRRQDADNIQPRLGFAYQLNDRTVLRGGGGLYYPDVIGSQFTHSTRITKLVYVTINNDGRPDFATNPFNGPTPTYSQALARMCDVNGGAPGCLRRDAEELAPPEGLDQLTDTWQMSLGVQHQLRNDLAFEVDYVRNRSRNEKVLHSNANVAYNPATGVNYPFSNTATRVYPLWGAIGYYAYTGKSDYHGLQTTVTKRFSDRWQFSGNYTLSQVKNNDPSQPISGHTLVPFPVAIDLGGEYGIAETDQRHRAVFNGIWEVGYGFQLSGLYFYGSGQRLDTVCGGDRRDIQGASAPSRLCADGTIVPRNSFVQDSIHRVDMRFQQRVPLGGRVNLDGIFELFNVFDRANYQSYTTDRSSPNYGTPNPSTNISYAPRTIQLGFRLQF